jgi:hypothetical protein
VSVSASDSTDSQSAAVAGATYCEVRQLESAQLPRICDVADPKIDVLFVSPMPLSEEVERYWNCVLSQVCTVFHATHQCLVCFAAHLA